MKYAIRAVKYFFYFSFIVFVMMLILIAFGLVEKDIDKLFRNGWDSVWQIAILFAFVSAFYPMFGFVRKSLTVPVDAEDVTGNITRFMADKGYDVETTDGNNMTFRARSAVQRVCKIGEDRITFTKDDTGYMVEGLRKDVFRLVYGIEYILRNQKEEY